MRLSLKSCLALALGTSFAMVLVVKAGPAAIVRNIKNTQPQALAIALGLHLGLVGLRGWRLQVLSRQELSFRQAFLLVATVQAASSLFPWRLGELLLPPLARIAVNSRLAKGAFWWLAGRFLDLSSLVMAASAAIAFGWLPLELSGAALLLLLALVATWRAAPRRRPWRWLAGLTPSRRWVKGLWRFRHALLAFQNDKGAQVQAISLSLAAWVLVAGFTGVLATGMGLTLSTSQVALAVVGAALGAAIPLAGLGNFGPLEAGFATALSLAKFPPQKALALGFALHFWTLLFQLSIGSLAAFWLFRTSPTRASSRGQDLR